MTCYSNTLDAAAHRRTVPLARCLAQRRLDWPGGGGLRGEVQQATERGERDVEDGGRIAGEEERPRARPCRSRWARCASRRTLTRRREPSVSSTSGGDRR